MTKNKIQKHNFVCTVYLFCFKIHEKLKQSLETCFFNILIQENYFSQNILDKPIRKNKFFLNAKFFDSGKKNPAKITSFEVYVSIARLPVSASCSLMIHSK